MEQIGRSKTKYISPHTSTWSANQTINARVPPDAYWKYTQRNSQDTIDKSTRRHQSPMPESTVNYYSSANSYKTLKHNAYPYSTHPKQSSALHAEVPQRYQQITTKTARNKDRIDNVDVINKDRYKTQQEDENNTEYIDDELGNFTEDNLEEDAEEEAENNRSRRNDKRVEKSINKEYDEQEADDEIDEESDAPAETRAIQRNTVKKDALLRAQRMRMINQQQDPHRIRYSQQSPKLYPAYHLPTRYYHNTHEHDIHETLSEEDLYTAQAVKNSPRRLSMGYHQNWIPQRSSIDRYDTMASLTRRARTRPEIKSFTEAELADRRKCSRCGTISTRKPSTSRRNNCRFQDNSAFSTKARFGDDAEVLDQSWCSHCKPKHHFEGNIGLCEIPPSALYTMKSRRPRNTNISMHETLEEKHPMDEISHEFARMSSRYTKDTPNTLSDRIRHSAQTAQGATRIPARYDP
ncbi:PREDICTED: uncharacterized protein LOC108777028 isoform X2 [Cyphomyrmex costatus]|uniref:Uncharacterized protein n=1 Tax=Cyphomyrmex costatus TaxID=456900 RepID=A0A195CG48_9HYME|nr:PREDICTED: uncharacterized protein LOC108777028 isoform X2 [Cyphomyrmex costatus]KYM99073.1 hypothetical protein ALC62_10187 [Cyphomyrmex costatus]